MKFIIFEQLSSLAHLKHNTQPSSFWILLFILIPHLQYLALMLPFNGWNAWKYSDGHFKLIQIISQTFLIVPQLIDQTIDFSQLAFAITIGLLIAMISIIIILFIFGYLGNFNPAQYYTIRKFIFYFVVLQSTAFKLPILMLFISQIIIGSKFNNNDSIFNVKGIINFITLILFTIITLLQQYFLRAYTFVPFNYFQSKFNLFQGIQYFTQILLSILYFLNSQYALISFLYLSIILKIVEFMFAKPYIPWNNQLSFSLSGTLLALLFIISFNIFTQTPESRLIYEILIFGSLSFHLFQTIYERRSLLTFDAEINSFTCIPFTQEMHFKYLIAAENQKQKEFFELYLYWKSHKVVCTRHWLKPNYKTDYNQVQRTHQTIFCILNTELDRAKLDSQQAYEELQILYISYVAQFCNKPLLAYVELKKYQSQHQIQTYYFQYVRQQLSIYIQNLITLFQLENRVSYFSKNVQNTDRQLSIQEIFSAFQFQDGFLPKVKDIITDKINFWNKQIKGFNDIYEIESQWIRQSKKIINLAQKITDHCNIDIYNIDHISLSTNVQDLKLISIFCSSIMNDYHSTQLCESTISEVYNIEHTLSEDTITNLSFIQEKAVIIMMSMVKNRGKIVNQDKKLVSSFFGYSEQEFLQFENIQDLMPSFFGLRHDKQLVNYLQTAKSQFLDEYIPIFGKSRNQMLIPYQLKIDNNFLSFDDYVIIGCLSQIKKSSDFIIFGDDGFLIGTTDNFFNNIISNQISFPQDIVSLINIFFLIPNISEMVNDLKQNYSKEFGYQDKYFRIAKFTNYKDLIDASQKLQFSRQFSMGNDTSILKSKTSLGTQEQEKAEKQIYQQLGQIPKSKSSKGEALLQSLAIFHSTYQNQISNAQQQLEGKQKIIYLARLTVQFKVIGKKETKKGYFILEINDLKKADELRANDSLMNNPQTGSLTLNGITSVNTNGDSSIGQVDREEVTPNISIQGQSQQPKFARLLQKYESKPQHMQYMEELGMESGRDSMSYGPLSQRINFISPSSKQQHIQDLLDKDFTDLQNQLEFGENIEEKQESSRVKSNSNQANQKSNNLLEIFTKNKLEDKIENLNQNSKKSKSSVTSGTSGVSAISTIKKFQQRKNMTTSLKWLTAINSMVVLIFLGYMIAHLLQVSEYDSSILQTLANINGPMLFNRYFFKLFTYTWSLIFNTLNIIESSDYLITQTIVQMEDLAAKIFVSLNDMYDLFIGVEQQGLLTEINLDFLYQSSENVTYTYFIDFISNTAQILFLALNYNITTLIDLVDQNYMDNLLTLRYNLKNVVDMNFQLIDSLNTLFFQQQSDTITQFEIQVIIEVIVLFLIIIVQLIYWRQLEQYCQQIILLAGRLQFNQAQELIIRFTAIQETLQQLSGKQCWKQSNYYKMLFFPLNQIGIETIQTQSRILKEYQMTQTGKKSLNFNPVVEQRRQYMKSSNVVLNSRINNTSISIVKAFVIIIITYIILLVYILGGYILYQQQQNDLYPTQQLTMSFIRFTSQLDIVVSTALITKSQPLFYSKLVDLEIYSQEQINTFRDQRKIIKIFIQLYSSYYENLTQIYENIIKSNKISSDDQDILLNLYQNNFCLSLLNEIPFCHYNDSDFDSNYGIPDSRDDNRGYLGKGIQGIVSQLDTMFKQNFQYEITNIDYSSDQAQLLVYMSSQLFTNAIMEHFIDTTDGTNLFVDKLMAINQKLISEDLILLYTYYLVAGILLLIIYLLFYGIWIKSSNRRLGQLRLILTNLPIDLLTEPQMLSSLKKLY